MQISSEKYLGGKLGASRSYMDHAVSVLRLPQVRQVTGLSRSTIYAAIKSGLFPPPFRLGPRAVGFSSAAIEAWLAARVAGKTDGDIRALVSSMNERR